MREDRQIRLMMLEASNAKTFRRGYPRFFAVRVSPRTPRIDDHLDTVGSGVKLKINVARQLVMDRPVSAEVGEARRCDGFRLSAPHKPIHPHQGPLFESRQGSKARASGHPAQQALWGIGWRWWRSVGPPGRGEQAPSSVVALLERP